MRYCAVGAGPAGERADYVVRLEAAVLDDRDVERLRHGARDGRLHREVVRGPGPLRLVVRVRRVAEGLPPLPVQFTRTQVKLEAFETDQPTGAIETLHGTPQNFRNSTTPWGASPDEGSLSDTLTAHKSLPESQIAV